MEQDYYVTEIPLTEDNVKEENLKEKSKLDPHITIITVQGAIVAIILIVCLIIKIFFGDLFLEMKDWYNKNANTDIDINQVLYDSSKVSGSGGPLEKSTTAFSTDVLGGFSLPMEGEITSKFGWRSDPFTGEKAFHNGLDIGADFGTAIYSALEGRVEKVSFDGDYGNYLTINHGGVKTLYAHCKTILVSEGDYIEKEEKIALCGSSGRSTGPHLHFEIRIGTTRIDPLSFLNY